MKINGLTLRASLLAALLATAPSAFAFGGLFDGGLFKSAEPASEFVVDDGSFFAGEALTIGEMAAPSPFFASAANESYSGCATCGDETGVVYGGGIPAAVDCCDPCAFVCDPCDPCVVGWGGYVSPYVPGQPVRNVLRGVRNLLSNCSLFCQPAYVCDPCWTVCDPCWSPCDPCWTSCETTCDGGYAPRCCGDGYVPGETNPLNPETGLPQADGASGLDAGVSPTPTLQTDAQAVGTYQDAAPAIPQSAPQLNAPAPSAAPETVPTPPADPNLGAGVLNMLVPEDAIVYVNGYRTKQTGAVRSFAAKSLEFGETYSFEIRVVAVRDGQVFEDVQHATLTAGQETALAFNLSLRSNQAVAAR
ncbi:MAG: TIGR03000 domain-containing protein [Thermoguttaceae bacterium]|nr:TIGR03000 domain-containing protein [Thermoguttaceae bacterium]